MSAKIANSPVPIETLLCGLAHQGEVDQGADISRGKENIAAKRTLSKQAGNEIEKMEKELKELSKKIKKEADDLDFFDAIGIGGGKRKLRRLQNQQAGTSAEVKKQQNELAKAKKQIEDELAKMKNALEAKEDKYKSLNDVVDSRGESYDATRT